jgi:hypothetical protein
MRINLQVKILVSVLSIFVIGTGALTYFSYQKSKTVVTTQMKMSYSKLLMPKKWL